MLENRQRFHRKHLHSTHTYSSTTISTRYHYGDAVAAATTDTNHHLPCHIDKPTRYGL